MGYAIFEGAHGSKFVGEHGFGEIVAAISQRSGVEITSHAREADCEPWLKQLGKMSQRELWNGWLARRPGFNPANPPGRSTHERRNDGVAYRWWPPGLRIPRWARGIDTANSPAFIEEARREGFTVSLTYPSSASERQHVNFRRQPRLPNPWKVRPLHRGATGPRVVIVTRLLTQCRRPGTDHAYLVHPQARFDAVVDRAVSQFQHDHHQKPDGTVGIHTIRQLRRSARYWKKAHGK